ncbi:hypothetical protein L6452_22277 [Arctium lappa]|uniref:Uncharacterized protein n=1 Tax=Arctium lappa TaxID=4217 RepID=A0ACB9B094_ARCLA|nr:hypothetical protein L6452_22277 [Arctium lappa]
MVSWRGRRWLMVADRWNVRQVDGEMKVRDRDEAVAELGTTVEGTKLRVSGSTCGDVTKVNQYGMMEMKVVGTRGDLTGVSGGTGDDGGFELISEQEECPFLVRLSL